jgi:hypothetical protein
MTNTVVMKLNNQLINQQLEPGAGISYVVPGSDSKQAQA